MIELPRWVHREQASCRVETLDGLREAESEGWRVNPNEPDVTHAPPVDEAAEAALLTELAGTLEAEEAELVRAVEDPREDAPESPQDDAGEPSGATEGDVVEAEKPRRGRPKKR